MFRRVIVPLDGSPLAERVLGYARVLGESLGAEIHLLRVVERRPPDLNAALNPALYEHKTLAYRKREAREYLAGVAEDLKADDLHVTAKVREGWPTRIIVEESADPETLILMASHGRSGAGRWLMGSVTDEVLHNSNKPVLVVGPRVLDSPDHVPAIDRVIAALDGSEFAEQVLPHACAVAEGLGVDLVLVKVTPASGLYYYGEGTEDGHDEEKLLPKDLDARAKDYLRKVERRLAERGAEPVKKVVLHGTPVAEVLAKYADESEAAVLAVATHGRWGLSRGIWGSVADDLVRLADRPLLLFRSTEGVPEGAAAGRGARQHLTG